ncbi:MAG: efflux RND transporter periplasmic adaptor subunit [Candidatus Binatia bacterium]|jgi:membrane fusion protein, copper/silver efflux system
MKANAKRGLSITLALLAGGAPAAGDPGAGSRAAIRLDARERQLAGLTYGTAERRSLEKVIRTVARLDVDERKLTAVTLKVGGYIKDLFVDYTGKPVRKGEPLFSIYSPDLVSAEQEYLIARETQKALVQTKVPSAAESAASLLRASRERLRLWDVSEQQIRAIEEAGEPSLYQTVRSPASGVVLEKMIIAGQSVQAGMTLYRIADLSTIWVYGDVYEYELPFVKVGQPADIRLSSAPARVFHASVAYVYPTLDPKTRTVKVRFELENHDFFLRPEMFGSVELRVPLGERLVVPKTAVLDSGRRQLVFLSSDDGRLTPREVELGDRVDEYVEIRRGLSAGERVVTSANFLVDSESQLQGAESMMGMMGAIGMGDWKMESARPMAMGAAEPANPPAPSQAKPGLSSTEEKQVGDLRVAVFAAAETAKVGESAIRVSVHDAGGAPVGQAKVSFNYTMDMAGMAIASAEAKELGDGVYEGTATFTMSGPWGLIVQVDRPGKPTLREKFTVRVGG